MATQTPAVPSAVGGRLKTPVVRKRYRVKLSTMLAQAALISLSIMFIIPFFWLLTTSLKFDSQLFVWPPVWVPVPANWDNYVQGLTFFPFFLYLKNTMIICVMSVLGAMISTSMVAYGIARITWPGRNILFVLILATMMLPGQVTIIPLFIIFKNLGWVNSFKPLIIPHFFAPAFFVFLLRQFLMTIPTELSDAARIDGASELGIFLRIILPLTRPALATIGLFQFLNSWNDFLGPLIYLSDSDRYTLSIGLTMFKGQYGSYWGQMMAVTTVMTIPIIVLFFFTQRTFIQGITLSGIKG